MLHIKSINGALDTATPNSALGAVTMRQNSLERATPLAFLSHTVIDSRIEETIMG